MRRLAMILLLVAGPWPAGCVSYEAGFFPYGEVLEARGPEARVELFRGEPERPHRELGELVVTGGTYSDFAGLRAALVRKAREVGADAVKLVRLSPVPVEYEAYGHGAAFYYPGYWGWGWGLGWGYPYYESWVRHYMQVRGVAIVWADEAGP